MKVIKVDGRYTFDYKHCGLIFMGFESVLMLECRTGRTVRRSLASLKKGLAKESFETIECELMLTNHYKDKEFEVIGYE